MMEASFWHQKWESNQIAFHEIKVNPSLEKYFKTLSLSKGARVFLPLCGKSLDMPWMRANGHRVVGVELSKIAVTQFFAALAVTPKISEVGAFTRYSTDDIEIFHGNIFDLSREVLGPVDAVYDRAALVALPETMRGRYTAHLIHITHTAEQLLICYTYDQEYIDGPPFSVTREEVMRHYSSDYGLRQIASNDVPGGLKGVCVAKENVWLLKKNRSVGASDIPIS